MCSHLLAKVIDSWVSVNQVAARIRGTTQYVFQDFTNAIVLEGSEAQFLS